MSEQRTTDFCWIRIRIFGQDTDGMYRVEAELDDGSWHKQVMKLGKDEEEELIRRRDLGTKSYGRYLYKLLFESSEGSGDSDLAEQTLDDVFQKAWGRAQASEQEQLRVQLWISEECMELHRIRWERLFVCLDKRWRSLANFEQTPFSRFTRLPIPEPQLNPDDRPLKVLLAVSNPSDLGGSGDDDSDALNLAEIKVEQEVESFYEAVKNVDDIEVTVMPGRTGISDKLEAKLNERKSNSGAKFKLIKGNTSYPQIQKQFNHHVLHFLGHGVFERVPQQSPDGAPNTSAQSRQRATLLVLEDENGKSVKVPDDRIVDYLVHLGTLPRLVFLSACDTAKFDERNPSPFTGLGPKLVAAGFQAVVAMQDQVPIEMARELAQKFYTNLLSEGVIDLALNRSRLFSFDPDGLLDNWTIPVLFMRTPRGRLFSANRERETLRAILESPIVTGMFKYGALPLEAVMLVGDQIKSNWENQILPQQGRMDLHRQLMSLLDHCEGKQPLYIAITGQRGTARSTAMRWLVTCTARQSLEAESKDQILPVYIDLQKCVPPGSAVPDYLWLIAKSLSDFWPGTITEKEMERLLKDGKHKFRFFFDNADDLSDSQRRALVKEINELINDYPAYPCLVTKTRGIWDWVSSYVTHVLDVQPLSRRRIIRFLFDSANMEQDARIKRGETVESREEQNLRKLRRVLEETQLFDLAGMPWMFVQLIKQALNGEFPESRVNVLQDLTEDKVRDVTQRRGLQARAMDTLNLLAYRMQVGSDTMMPIKDALELFSKVRDNREYQLEDMLESLEGVDLLARAGGDSARFLYSSYQAYCCAQYLKIQNNPKRWEEITAGLGRVNHLRRWDDTLTLLAGMVSDPGALLEKIAYSTSLKEGEQVFLAARCLLEARLNGNGSKSKDALWYVESLVMDALVWRMDSENEPRSFQRLRAVEALGRLRRPEVMNYLVRVVMKKTRVNSNGRADFEYGGVRQAAGRALRRLLPPREKADPNEEYTAELRKLCQPLEQVVQKWIKGGPEQIQWLEKRMRQPNTAKKDENKGTVNDALASMAAFALGDMRDEDAHKKLIAAFTDDKTAEVIRWAITDALATLEPEMVMGEAILPIIESGKLDDPIKFSERREQLIYLIGQLRHPDEKARAFVEDVLKSPRAIILQKGRAILAVGYLLPPEWKMWKTQFENIVLNEDNIIAKKVSDKSKGTYLRTKALQALAEIGDAETLTRLREKKQQLPSDLERTFYSASEEIIWRINE